MSTAAGVVVTRVASAEGERALAAEVADQVLGSSRTLGVAATLMAVLALVPGLPTVPFVVLALALGMLALRAHRRATQLDARAPRRIAL